MCVGKLRKVPELPDTILEKVAKDAEQVLRAAAPERLYID
jgi:hypothetical protein